ncbi:transposable element Tcb1 transposase [Trichonephila clavipes]|nr:transposable element Tcb1 transposase [Trichonephila clavipes]
MQLHIPHSKGEGNYPFPLAGVNGPFHSYMSARTNRRRLQQSGLSARSPLLGLPLMQNHRRLCHQWCDERRMWVSEWNEVVFTEESHISVCNTTMVGFDSGDTMERRC